MVSEKLKENSRLQLLDTLENMADDAEMLRYKKAVPFVHIPVELANQWDNHNRLFRTQDWFRELFTASQIEAALAFDEDFNRFLDHFGEDIPDVPEILDHPEWHRISALAGEFAKLVPFDPAAD